MSLGDEVEFSLEEFINEFKSFLNEVNSHKIGCELLDRCMRGSGREEYDFTGTSGFFRKFYPKLKELYYVARAKGIMQKHIED